jgi:hypothetical protein
VDIDSYLKRTLFACTCFGTGLGKVRVVYASRGLPFFTAFVAKEMRFYQKHGLEAELIQMAPRIALTALATNRNAPVGCRLMSCRILVPRSAKNRSITITMPVFWRLISALANFLPTSLV